MKNITFSIVFILVGFSSIAQERSSTNEKPKPPTPTEILERITKDVNLTEVQQKQFKAFLDAQETKPRPTEKERNSRGEKDRKEMDAKLKVILTQAQYAKWQEIKSKRKPLDNKPEGIPRNDK